MKQNKKITLMLSIAGSDNTSGAGVQADIKTCQAMNAYCLNCVTAVTSQDSKKVYNLVEIPDDLVVSQISTVINEYGIDCIKIGMISNLGQAKKIHALLSIFKKKIPIVIDPIYKSTTNKIFNNLTTYLSIYKTFSKLKPIFTPNLFEFKKLIKTSHIENHKMKKYLELFLQEYRSMVVVTNCNEGDNNSDDYFITEDGKIGIHSLKSINSKNTHGTGCTFSTSLAINLARGFNLSQSILRSKKLMTKFIKKSPNFNLSYGPLGHLL